MSVYTKQSTLVVIYIYYMHIEADHSFSKVEKGTISHNKPRQPYGEHCYQWKSERVWWAKYTNGTKICAGNLLIRLVPSIN